MINSNISTIILNMNKRLTLQMLFLIILNDAGEAIAQLLMKGGLNKIAITSLTFSNLPEFCLKGITSPLLWLGMIVYTLNFFIWIVVLSRIDLSVAVPVCSFSYIFVPFLSIAFLGEIVSPLRWIGIIVIITGIYFVSKSTEIKTMPL